MNETVKSCVAFSRGSNVHSDHSQSIEALCIAVEVLNGNVPCSTPPSEEGLKHIWTPEELAQREKLLKPMKLYELYLQLEVALSGQPDSDLWIIGDFEIRRRK